jgi:hypothetical protein
LKPRLVCRLLNNAPFRRRPWPVGAFVVLIILIFVSACLLDDRLQGLGARVRHVFEPQPATTIVPVIPSPTHARGLRALCESFQAELKEIRPESLPAQRRQEYFALERLLVATRRNLLAEQSDPSLYNLGAWLKKALARPDVPLEERWNNIEATLELAAVYYDSAKAILEAPVDYRRAMLAAHKQQKTLAFLQGELTDSLMSAALPSEKHAAIFQRIGLARIAVKDFLAYCQSLAFDHSDAAFRTNGSREKVPPTTATE